MARWTSLPHTSEVLEQAERWKLRCLQDDRSIFTDLGIWSPENVAELKRLFVDNPIEGNQTFYEKLTQQLGGATPEVSKLAAEVLWLLLLFVYKESFGIETKVSRIKEVWSLSGDDLPASSALTDEALSGLANPGTAFLTKIWAEFGFVVLAIDAWKRKSHEEQEFLLTDHPWELCGWLTGVDGGAARSARHMLLYCKRSLEAAAA